MSTPLSDREKTVRAVRKLAETADAKTAEMLEAAAHRLEMDGMVLEYVGQIVKAAK